MCKFEVGMKVYTICKLDPKRIGIVQSITPTGRINVAFSNGCGSTFTMQFGKNGTNGKGYFQTTLGIPTPEIEEEIRRQDVILNARRVMGLLEEKLSYEEAVKIIEIYESREGQSE